MSALFTPLTVGAFTVRNRVALPPMVCAVKPSLGARGADDAVTDALAAHYARVARAGTGLVIVEATAVDAGGRCWAGGIGAYDDRFLPGLAQLAAAIRAEGAVAGIQLVHAGPQGSAALNGENVGPSAVPARPDGPVPRALTVAEIHAIQARFAAAALRCADAGFQYLELHGAHGFLLDSFLMKSRNARTDAYGGSRAGRLRMLEETCRLVRGRLGRRALLGCRISLFNKLDEGGDPGARLEALVRGLEAAGLDLLHLSTDGALRPAGQLEPEMGRAVGAYGQAAAPTLGQVVKTLTRLPLIIAGGLGDPHDADRAVADGHADLAAVGRAMLDDPEWTLHAREALG
ncbi:MAG TPA: NADH:flavin oxidoreductase/NADH oxidase [Armatimonadota bacterium]|nr:NADH:flavin oxidoreductase/NADH oxidase [Armatimonadota bacterium]HOS43409.1 NADH:flavin oxidoreductase/NADH oxidase [Armatimonadota bacterium]